MTDTNIQMKYFQEEWKNLFPRTLATITLMADGRTVEQAITDFNQQLDDFETSFNENLEDKVDKEDGKGLSSNDFTNAFKTKLDNLRDHSQDINNLQINKADKANTYTKAEVDNIVGEISTGIVVSPDEPEDAFMWFEEIGG